jgi:hypothetical protein
LSWLRKHFVTTDTVAGTPNLDTTTFRSQGVRPRLSISAPATQRRHLPPVVGPMKEYRLTAWPDLGPQHQRTAYRRMLSDMSQRHLSVAELCARSGLSRSTVAGFLEQLDARGLLLSRDAVPLRWPISLRPLRDWVRRTRLLSPRGAPR